MKAYVNIVTKTGTALQVVKRLRQQDKEVLSVDALYGRFDAVCVIQAGQLEELDKIVYDVIQSDPNVLRTETSIVLGFKTGNQ